jgi:two-component system, NtrC family, nitrogen regulation sensor histidine kinase NtrY
MVFNSFRALVALRVLLLVAAISLAAWGWLVVDWLVTPIVSGVLALLLAFELIWYVERGQRELAAFLSSMLHQDFSTPPVAQNRGRSFDELETIYLSLSDEFKRLNLQKAANHQYLEAVVEHIGVALICLDEIGQIVMINEPARTLFDLPHAHWLRGLARFDERLPALIGRLRHGDRDLLRVRQDDEVLQLVLYVTEFSLLDRQYKLVSFQDIRDELERREIESWQKLIRVLTHEIMNSVTPIISLSKLVQDELMAQGEGAALPPGSREDLLRSVHAVHSRSSGLLEFVKAYRSFASVPVPQLQHVEVAVLLQRVRVLMDEFTTSRGIAMEVRIEGDALAIRADPRQIEQVLINLIRNAAEALAGCLSPAIRLRAAQDERGRILIQVIDNGAGIDAVHLDNIFVPFFTTKRGGTGVGLSISRQLVQANQGFISAKAGEVGGCVFSLLFPAVLIGAKAV